MTSLAPTHQKTTTRGRERQRERERSAHNEDTVYNKAVVFFFP